MASATPASATPVTGDRTVKLFAQFTAAPTSTRAQYDESIARLQDAGEFPPDGLAFHVAFGSPGHLRVSEIWDSREQFEAFGQRLMPILAEIGIELAGEPEVTETYNIITR